jgi:branched-chain amino acid transport system substrate-binding protein
MKESVMGTYKIFKSIVAVSTISVFPALAAIAEPVINVGSVVSATGPAASLGEPEEKTLRLYVDKINAAGGVAGRKINLIVYDDGGDANKARTFATRLIEDDKIVAMVGGSTTGTTMAMMPLFEEAGVPFISMAGAIGVVEPVRKYIFKTPHTDKMACQKIFEEMKQRKLTKIGMISGTDGFGASMREQCIKVASSYGIEIGADETYGPADSDMTAQLTRIRSTAGIQAIINPGIGQGPAIVTRNYGQLGMTAMALYQSHGVASKSFIDLAGQAAEGIRLPAPAVLVGSKLPDGDPQKAVVTDYTKTYEQATKLPVSSFGGYAYNALLILVDAIKRADGTDPGKIRDEIESTRNFVGTDGVVTMSPTDHLGLDSSAFRMVEVKHGEWSLVQPGH